MSRSPLPPPLLYADSESNADALYFGRVHVPDPFLAFAAGGRKHAVVSALEFGRVRRDSDFDVVLPLEDWVRMARRRWRGRPIGAAEVMRLVAEKTGQRAFTVAGDFPVRLCDRLRRLGLRIQVAEGPLFPRREIKSREEAAAIRQGNACSARGLAAAERTLRRSRIRGGRLLHRGRVLTSEALKFEIEVACLEAGAISANTIAAGGDQACDPHERGSGPLRPNELIIVDIFPRVTATGYYGDMTRTFLRGRASGEQRRLVETVRAGQKAALKAIRAGAEGPKVHAGVVELFQARGYETKATPERSIGFFHGTGHGVGLAIHEPPRVSSSADVVLRAGTVVTVEPGLYYPGLGGCRIEDVVQVRAGGADLLSSYPYRWEL